MAPCYKEGRELKTDKLSVVCEAHCLPQQFIVNPKILASLRLLLPARRHQLRTDAIPDVFQFKTTLTGLTLSTLLRSAPTPEEEALQTV